MTTTADTGRAAPRPRFGISFRRASTALGVWLAAAVALAACGDSDALPAAQPQVEPGLGHVHGLGVNPADGDLYAATHFGLWRVRDGSLERVGDAHHDLMGFSVLGEDHFAASGHPLLEEDELPPNLGYIVSDDGGHTWRSDSLMGQADFHALVRTGDGLYGYDASGQRLLHRPDSGDWSTRHDDILLTGLAADPEDNRHLLAGAASDITHQDAELLRSRGGGRNWEPIDGPGPLRLSWKERDRLFAVDGDGRLHRSTDGGEHWEQQGPLPAVPGALLDHNGRLFADAGDHILVSDDDGSSWEVYATTGHP